MLGGGGMHCALLVFGALAGELLFAPAMSCDS